MKKINATKQAAPSYPQAPKLDGRRQFLRDLSLGGGAVVLAAQFPGCAGYPDPQTIPVDSGGIYAIPQDLQIVVLPAAQTWRPISREPGEATAYRLGLQVIGVDPAQYFTNHVDSVLTAVDQRLAEVPTGGLAPDSGQSQLRGELWQLLDGLYLGLDSGMATVIWDLQLELNFSSLDAGI